MEAKEELGPNGMQTFAQQHMQHFRSYFHHYQMKQMSRWNKNKKQVMIVDLTTL